LLKNAKNLEISNLKTNLTKNGEKMIENTILLKYGELILKGLNRPAFEAKLVSDVKHKLRNFGEFSVTKSQSTIFIKPLNGGANLAAAFKVMKKVFGIANVCLSASCEKSMDEIRALSLNVIKDALKTRSAATFKVETVREDKNFPLNSMEISRDVGGFILENLPSLKVNVRKPNITVYVEVRKDCYVYTKKERGIGGMPRNSCGSALLLLSGGIDSPVAGFMAAKRGAHLSAIHFHSYPYTTEKAKEKVIELAEILSEYAGPVRLFVVPFTELQLKIIENFPKKFITIIIRRFMMKIASAVAEQNNILALATGESVGQVASQTLEAIAVTNAAAKIPVLRPVICMDKEEIITIARNIGTYETSILPFEDCCTIFVPKHPATKPSLAEILALEESAEAAANLEKHMIEAIENTEAVVCGQ
jgi:thiamine biosynthesis protein ThiI